MRNTPIVLEVRRRLLSEGFSRTYATRTARELREHWEDLVEESIRQGLTRAEAEVQASLHLGPSQQIGDQLASRLRATSWLGRNPTAGFAALALLTTYLWWFLLMMAAGAATGLWTWIGSPPENAFTKVEAFRTCSDWIRTLSYVILPFLICFIAQRYACGWKPSLWGCLIIAFHNATHFFTVNHRDGGHGDVAWGYSFSMKGPELLPILAPLAVFLLFTLWRLRPEPTEKKSDLQPC